MSNVVINVIPKPIRAGEHSKQPWPFYLFD